MVKRKVQLMLRNGIMVVITVIITSCGNRVSGNLPPNATVYTAELVGEVHIKDSCVSIKSSYDSVEYTLIWPSTWHVDVDSDKVVIQTTPNVSATLTERDRVWFDGGELSSSERLTKPSHGNVSTDCPGPFWLVGSAFERYP